MGHHDSFFGNPKTWIGVAFIIFFVIFGRKMWQSVTSMLDQRAEAIRRELGEASRLRSEAEKMLSEAKASREQATKEAEATLAQARQEADRVAEASRVEAAGAAKRRERLAMERIAAAEKAALTDVRFAAADAATRAARQVISQDFSAVADRKLIDHAIQGLPAALSGRRVA